MPRVAWTKPWMIQWNKRGTIGCKGQSKHHFWNQKKPFNWTEKGGSTKAFYSTKKWLDRQFWETNRYSSGAFGYLVGTFYTTLCILASCGELQYAYTEKEFCSLPNVRHTKILLLQSARYRQMLFTILHTLILYIVLPDSERHHFTSLFISGSVLAIQEQQPCNPVTSKTWGIALRSNTWFSYQPTC